jgi:hypothetical protein
MGNQVSTLLQSIDDRTLMVVVRQALGSEILQLRGWQVSELGGGAGNPVSAGLYRFEGIGQENLEPVPWSVILKIIQSPANVGWENMGEGDDRSHWNYWKREMLAFQSGILRTLPAGLTAPRCYGTLELPENLAMLWLEDIRDSYAGKWPLDRYALTARHLGLLNGSFLCSRPLPEVDWFSRERNRQWMILAQDWHSSTMWEHPLARKRYGNPEKNAFRHFLAEAERFLTALDQLPKTLCHGDTFPTNFMARRLSSGQEQTVALDWALMGIQPIGDDLGQFVFGAQNYLSEISKEEITRSLFEQYLDGLRENGCRLDEIQVRFGFTAGAALRVGLFQLFLLGELIKQSKLTNEGDVEYATAPDCFEVVMAKEAIELIGSI